MPCRVKQSNTVRLTPAREYGRTDRDGALIEIKTGGVLPRRIVETFSWLERRSGGPLSDCLESPVGRARVVADEVDDPRYGVLRVVLQ